MSNSKKVFVVQGGDTRLRDDFFAFLRTMNLQPVEWAEALNCAGEASAVSGEVLEKAFRNAQAVIVLLSPDNVGRSPEFGNKKDDGN
jgi:predicted nucleotide-binding protein